MTNMELDDKNRSADEWLDIALKHYGDAEPRSGLEGRVLATLRFERKRITVSRWNLWPALAGVAVLVVLGASIALVREHRIKPVGVATQQTFPPVEKTPPLSLTSFVSAPKPTHSRTSARSAESIRDSPHLSQFPSPQPLNEQEEILARYVRENTQEAVLLAQARAELLKKDLLEFQAPTNSAETSSQSEE
jgi:hypothetical protein